MLPAVKFGLACFVAARIETPATKNHLPQKLKPGQQQITRRLTPTLLR
jgi:hypothetical protein